MALVDKIETKTLSVKGHMQTFDIPVGITNILIRNNSIDNIDIRFDTDLKKDKYTLTALKELPPIQLRGGINKIKYESQSGSGELQLLMWG